MPQKELNKLLSSLAEVVMDQDFITQVLSINDDIGNMSAENWQSNDVKPLKPPEEKEKSSSQPQEHDAKKDDEGKDLIKDK